MRKVIVFITTASLFINIHSQDNNVRDNIIKAKENNGVEYSNDSSVKKVINIAKIENYYKWAESADTSGMIDNSISWDITSLRNTLENYRNTSYDYKDILSKCRLIAESLRMKNAEMQVATVVDK